jgi:molybdopterin converting factor small subunit
MIPGFDCGFPMRVEFFGVPRDRAGTSEMEVHADTLGQLLETLATRIPSLDKIIGGNGSGVRLHPSFVANLNGDRFVSDPRTPLGKDDCVLILSADAGG